MALVRDFDGQGALRSREQEARGPPVWDRKKIPQTARPSKLISAMASRGVPGTGAISRLGSPAPFLRAPLKRRCGCGVPSKRDEEGVVSKRHPPNSGHPGGCIWVPGACALSFVGGGMSSAVGARAES